MAYLKLPNSWLISFTTIIFVWAFVMPFSLASESDDGFGCIEVFNELFDENNNPLFTGSNDFAGFYIQLTKQDGSVLILQTDIRGRVRFDNVPLGIHNVTLRPTGNKTNWQLINVTPPNGQIVLDRPDICVSAVFKNRKIPKEPQEPCVCQTCKTTHVYNYPQNNTFYQPRSISYPLHYKYEPYFQNYSQLKTSYYPAGQYQNYNNAQYQSFYSFYQPSAFDNLYYFNTSGIEGNLTILDTAFVSIKKEANLKEAAASEIISYTVSVQNESSLPAYGLQIEDNFEDNLVRILNPGGANITSHGFTWVISVLPPNGKQTFSYQVQLFNNLTEEPEILSQAAVRGRNVVVTESQEHSVKIKKPKDSV